MLFFEIVLVYVTHFRRIHQFPVFLQFFLSMIWKQHYWVSLVKFSMNLCVKLTPINWEWSLAYQWLANSDWLRLDRCWWNMLETNCYQIYVVNIMMSPTSSYLGNGQFGKQTKPPWVVPRHLCRWTIRVKKYQIIFLKLFSDTLLILLRLNFFWFHYLAARPEISFIIFCA